MAKFKKGDIVRSAFVSSAAGIGMGDDGQRFVVTRVDKMGALALRVVNGTHAWDDVRPGAVVLVEECH